jgi:hypothetical protein
MRKPLLICVALAAAMSLAACGTTPSRAGRLLTIAGEEANLIDSLSDRLTRQLNIADLQIQANQKGEAIKTLALATATLRAEEKDTKLAMDDFRKIAGWTSVAELNKRAGEDKGALGAYLNAVEALNSVKPVATRAQYVLSLSQICNEIRGKQEAIALLVKGGEWAREITHVGTRRYAIFTFSESLVGYDDLEAARTTMRNEPDPRWRSDALMAMGRNEIYTGVSFESKDRFLAFAQARTSRGLSEKSPATQVDMAFPSDEVRQFNKNLRYEDNFRQQSLQQGQRPQ